MRKAKGEGMGTSAGRTLRRMARTRRLVTSLSRLLATKSEVVARMQKRLLQVTAEELAARREPTPLQPPMMNAGPTVAQINADGLDGGLPAASGVSAIPIYGTPSGEGKGKERRSEADDIAIYYGDVQGNDAVEHSVRTVADVAADHILTLYQSFAHLERMLSQSHPTYCSQLRVMQRQANSRMDRTIMLLSCVTVGVYCIQPTVGTYFVFFHDNNVRYLRRFGQACSHSMFVSPQMVKTVGNTSCLVLSLRLRFWSLLRSCL
jgi:magnesium transporter